LIPFSVTGLFDSFASWHNPGGAATQQLPRNPRPRLCRHRAGIV